MRGKLTIRCIYCGYESKANEFLVKIEYEDHIEYYLRCPKCGNIEYLSTIWKERKQL